jgi:transposase InsO family protein
MRQDGIRAILKPRKRAVPEEPARECPPAPNLLQRNFAAPLPNRVWVGDITEIATGDGMLYLGAVMDLHSRMIVGWAMAERKDKTLVCDALQMAIGRRRPPAGLLHHTDQGSQYGALAYNALLSEHKMVASMSRKGEPYDNAPMESWIRTLKVECVYRLDLTVRREVKEAIVEYIELHYNSRRRHSTLGYLSPAEFERRNGLA